MNSYEIWFNLAPGAKDLEVVAAIESYLGYLKERDLLVSYRIRRRKFGFGPEGLGEFNVTIDFHDLAQLDQAFLRAATRDAEVEPLHHAVFSRVVDFKSGLYRDFPDEVRRI
jgi:hypothetical protein